jgi:hypothetical protein
LALIRNKLALQPSPALALKFSIISAVEATVLLPMKINEIKQLGTHLNMVGTSVGKDKYWQIMIVFHEWLKMHPNSAQWGEVHHHSYCTC